MMCVALPEPIVKITRSNFSRIYLLTKISAKFGQKSLRNLSCISNLQKLLCMIKIKPKADKFISD